MDQYIWNYRPVLVFTPSAAHEDYERQKTIIESAQAAFRERDIVVIHVAGDAVTHQFGPSPAMSATELRRKFGIDPQAFEAVLVGKDGGVKLRSSSPFSAQKLSSVIDAMPMRQREMREGGQ